jgi:cell division protein ZapA
VGQIAITLNDRTYRLRCGDGEEQRLLELATHVSARVEGLVAEFGQVGDDRLMLMAALMITDELWEARAEAAELRRVLTTGAGIASATVSEAEDVASPYGGDTPIDADVPAPPAYGAGG